MSTKKRVGSSGSPRRSAPELSQFSPGLFVGGWNDAVGFEGECFCVLDDPPGREAPPATHVRIYDEEHDRALVENLDRLSRAMEKAHSGGRSVMVFCGHGVRRSPLAAAWYLRRVEGLSLVEAYARIRSVRPGIETAAEWIGHPENLE